MCAHDLSCLAEENLGLHHISCGLCKLQMAERGTSSMHVIGMSTLQAVHACLSHTRILSSFTKGMSQCHCCNMAE